MSEVSARAVEARRAHAAALLGFVAANLALMAIDGYGYILAAGGAPGSAGWLFAHLALLAQLSVANLLVGLVLLAVGRPGSGYRVVPLLGALAATALQTLVYVDRGIFAFYRFHTGGLALHLLAMPGGPGALHLHPESPTAFAAMVGALFAAEYAAFRLLLRRARARPTEPARLRWRWLAATAAVVALTVADHAVYGVSELHGDRDVTRAARLIPFYQPFTIDRLVRSHPPLAHALGGTGTDGGSTLTLAHYPLAPLRFRPDGPRPSIVWIVLDSWRADAFDAGLTPAIWRLGERAQVFTHHVSGSNTTRFGIFSMFYGLYAPDWSAFLEERRGPVLIAALRDLGYRIDVLSSLSLAFSDFRHTVFADAPDAVRTDFPGPRTTDRDRQVTAAFIASLDRPAGDAPFFATLLLESTHAGYDFDAAAAVYTPYATEVGFGGLGTGAERTAVVNRYRNAVHYADRLTGEVIDALERRGLLDRTIVVVTGDHGEEFAEHGYWGHNGAFTPEQTRVPLVVHVPDLAPARHAGLSSHHDLPATMLELLGVENPPTDYGMGRSLLGPAPDPYAVSCGLDECAMIDDARIVTFGVGLRDPHGVAVLDADYRPLVVSRASREAESRELLDVMAGASVFLR